MVFLPQVEAEWTARVAEVDNYRGFESTFIYDRYGNELYEAFGEGRRTRVSYEQHPRRAGTGDDCHRRRFLLHKYRH